MGDLAPKMREEQTWCPPQAFAHHPDQSVLCLNSWNLPRITKEVASV
jgi:hypothetical protein